MTLGEKYAALTGPENLKNNEVGLSGSEICQDGIYTFSEVLNSTCEKLMDKQIKYSIRRIREMNERLCLIERELDEFLLRKDK